MLDDTDRRILEFLQSDARIPNNALASAVGIAPSTCHGRVRRLVDIGVIRGFMTDIDPAAVGYPLRALIAVRLQSEARGKIRSFVGEIRTVAGVSDVFFLAGDDDFLMHVASQDTDGLRKLVEAINGRPEVAGTTTSLVFEHQWGASPIF
ncbi:putative AsnC family transcriptional regulator [Gordonia effusa NBRC 100432]|uniref:Putative AsnC family transcriptional regulator n=2 Tax=Gordonia effusa TaxID=263908 RepID=H0R3H0_9ACTN|nr:putative AsnC family transcriptional regulator [Gordonia effusa NBRC 100432]